MSVLIPNSDPNNFAEAFKAPVTVQTFVGESQTSVLIVGSNNDRRKLMILNESNRNVFLSYNDPAVLQQGFVLAPGDIWVEEVYTGAVYGVWSSGADKGARVYDIM